MDSPPKAEEFGFATVYQEVSLCPDLTVAQNIFLGVNVKKKVGLISWKAINEEANKMIRLLELDLDPEEKAGKVLQQKAGVTSDTVNSWLDINVE